MIKHLKLKRGVDLRLEGQLTPDSPAVPGGEGLFAICPEDYPGLQPKLDVKEGDTIDSGAPLLHDKNCEDIKLVSPVAGIVSEIARGERRRILRVVVKPAVQGSQGQTASHGTFPTTADEARLMLMRSGLWAMMRQRPYDIVPTPAKEPRDIFVTCFDSSPLAPDIIDNIDIKDLEAGVKLLKLLTKGNIYMSRRSDSAMPEVTGAITVDVTGPHPAGNAGVQAANLAPVNKGETIWTLDVTTLARIGRTALSGATPWNCRVGLTGSEVRSPKIIETFAGAQISSIIRDDIANDNRHHRIISGNVLTGRKVEADGFLRYPYRQVTVIPEGDDVDEFMGWASLSPSKMSDSPSFPSRLMPWKRFAPDARILGGRRAMIMSGLYEKMLPMDIMAEYLIKAIIARDIDRMESLGIYEVAPEDFALCEYVDPSKLPLQQIVRDGLDYLRKELE